MFISLLHCFEMIELILCNPYSADLYQTSGLEHWCSVEFCLGDLHHDRYNQASCATMFYSIEFYSSDWSSTLFVTSTRKAKQIVLTMWRTIFSVLQIKFCKFFLSHYLHFSQFRLYWILKAYPDDKFAAVAGYVLTVFLGSCFTW
jgi:hypothetical protein